MGGFPLHLDLEGRAVLVVGAGPVGRRRLHAARAAGARLRWVAPDAEPVAGVELRRRVFTPEDAAGIGLAFACGPPAVNAAVVAAVRAGGGLVVRADHPGQGDGIVPASLRRGALLVSWSTGGRAPAATAALREAIEARIPEAWGRFVELVAAARDGLPPGPARQAWLRRLARGPLREALERGDPEAVAAALTPAARDPDHGEEG